MQHARYVLPPNASMCGMHAWRAGGRLVYQGPPAEVAVWVAQHRGRARVDVPGEPAVSILESVHVD